MVRSGDDTLANVNTVSPYRRNTADRSLMAEAIGERDEGFLMELQSAGYSAETIVLAELTPQIQIAWADGEVSQRERDVIVESAAHRRILPQSRASLQLARWLERRPSGDLFSNLARGDHADASAPSRPSPVKRSAFVASRIRRHRRCIRRLSRLEKRVNG